MFDTPEAPLIFAAITLVVGLFAGFLFGIRNKKKTLNDFSGTGWIKKIHDLDPVFPSVHPTVFALESYDDEYKGAHNYIARQCLAFNPKTQTTDYLDDLIEINFAKKNLDGTVTPGLQSEQVVLMLIDRHTKLNIAFPHPENEKAISALRSFLRSQEARVTDRISKGTMGELKK